MILHLGCSVRIGVAFRRTNCALYESHNESDGELITMSVQDVYMHDKSKNEKESLECKHCIKNGGVELRNESS